MVVLFFILNGRQQKINLVLLINVGQVRLQSTGSVSVSDCTKIIVLDFGKGSIFFICVLRILEHIDLHVSGTKLTHPI